MQIQLNINLADTTLKLIVYLLLQYAIYIKIQFFVEKAESILD